MRGSNERFFRTIMILDIGSIVYQLEIYFLQIEQNDFFNK